MTVWEKQLKGAEQALLVTNIRHYNALHKAADALELVKAGNRLKDYEIYLKRFPDGKYVEEAKAALNQANSQNSIIEYQTGETYSEPEPAVQQEEEAVEEEEEEEVKPAKGKKAAKKANKKASKKHNKKSKKKK